MDNDIVSYQRPHWDEYFLAMAFLASTRSPDSQTQCGCVLVDKNHRILSVGYNGWIGGIDDSVVPNTRPKKYLWVLHAERNALHNCQIRPEGATAYVTGKPCLECLKAMLQEGIRDFVCANTELTVMQSEYGDYENEVYDKLLDMSGATIKFINTNFDRIVRILQTNNRLLQLVERNSTTTC